MIKYISKSTGRNPIFVSIRTNRRIPVRRLLTLQFTSEAPGRARRFQHGSMGFESSRSCSIHHGQTLPLKQCDCTLTYPAPIDWNSILRLHPIKDVQSGCSRDPAVLNQNLTGRFETCWDIAKPYQKGLPLNRRGEIP